MAKNGVKALGKAIRIAGSQRALAEKLGIGQTAISNWLLRQRVPAERVLAIEAAVEGQVTRHDLRPDLYPPEAAA